MVFGNTLQNVKDAYTTYTHAGAFPPSIPTNNMHKTKSQVDDEWTDDLDAGSSFEFNSARSASPGRLRTILSRRDAELDKEKYIYRNLEGNFKKAQDDLRQLKGAENRHIEDKTLSFIENHMQDYCRKRGHTFRPLTDRSVLRLLDQLLDHMIDNRNLREEAAERAKLKTAVVQSQARALQHQVHTLQQQLLDRVDRECAVSDDKFSKEFRCLTASVKSLSRSIHITRDTGMLETLGVGGLLIGVNSDHWNTRARKKCLAEAWIWSVLLDRIFASPFSLSEEHGSSMADLCYRLFGADHLHGWPTPSTSCEKWRCTTMEYSVEAFGLTAFIKSSVEDVAMEQDDGLDSLFQDNEAVSSKVRAQTINIISTNLAVVSPEGDFVQIPSIVDRAIALVLEMSLQRCRLQVTYPAIGAPFVDGQMTVMADFDGDDYQDGSVAYIVTPGLTKWGDANGKDLDQRYDIVPSLMQLQKRETREGTNYDKLELA
ncbi:hypothetical protein E8E11_002514 [Didymella keratinophila]|nr:hypothetical protein E8E11_002514 [Didymella keratinophila]